MEQGYAVLEGLVLVGGSFVFYSVILSVVVGCYPSGLCRITSVFGSWCLGRIPCVFVSWEAVE